MSPSPRVLRLVLEIHRNGTLAPTPCDRCFFGNHRCVAIMPSNPDAKARCAECTRFGRPCVNLSWSSLDRTREEYEKKVEEDENLLAEVLLRLQRNRKILRQAKERAKKKAECLASEMELNGELDGSDVDCPAVNANIAFSPLMWETLGSLERYAPTSESSAPS